MKDSEIIDLYLLRDKDAISETSDKYSSYCHTIADNILSNNCDVEECLNDTWLRVWKLIPPHRPKNFSAFLAKITRNLSIDVIRKNSAQKRGSNELNLVLDELSECIPSVQDVEHTVEQNELKQIINGLLHIVSERERDIVVCRYWYMDSIADIARRFNISENNAKTILFRVRVKLKKRLEEVFNE